MKAYIKILKYGCEQGSITYPKLIEYLNENDIRFFKGSPSITEGSIMLQNIFNSCFQDIYGNKPDLEKKGFYCLTIEALGYLLTYKSIEQARNDAKHARKQANVAIWLASASLFLAALIGGVQICVVLRGSVL